MLDPIIPYKAHDANDFGDMLLLKEKTGIHRFAVIGINNNVRLEGYPDDEAYVKMGELLRDLKKNVEPYGIEIHWWMLPTLKLGPGSHQRIVGLTGGESAISCCPLDEGLRQDMLRRIPLLVSIARPASILLEDDFEISNHPNVGVGCFCPLHLKKFADYAGREYTREELQELFTRKPLKAWELRMKWAQMSHDTMVDYAKLLRSAVDSVDPSIPMWLCEPGVTDLDGCLSRDVPRVLAGKGNCPAIRIFGTQYGSTDTGRDLPANLAHAMYSAEHLPEDFVLFHESDTYPHNRFFSSASLMNTIMTTAMMIGCDNSLFIGGQYLDNHYEEFGYFDMYNRNVARMRKIQQEIKGSELDGCQILYRPEFDFVRSQIVWEGYSAITGLKQCAKMMGRMGFPYTTRERKVTLLYGPAAENLSDEEVKTLLSKSVLMDADAATLLFERGFGKYLGVKIELVESLPVYKEYILDNAPVDLSRGRQIYNSAFAPSGSEGAKYARIRLDGAEAITVYRGIGEYDNQPALTRFVNSLGGRIAVMGCSFANESSNLYCYRKRELLRSIFTWLNDDKPLPAAILKAPNAWILFRKKGTEAILEVTNLSPDPLENLELALAPEWQGKQVLRMDADGQWQKLPCNTGETLSVPGFNAQYLKPEMLKLV